MKNENGLVLVLNVFFSVLVLKTDGAKHLDYCNYYFVLNYNFTKYGITTKTVITNIYINSIHLLASFKRRYMYFLF